MPKHENAMNIKIKKGGGQSAHHPLSGCFSHRLFPHALVGEHVVDFNVNTVITLDIAYRHV